MKKIIHHCFFANIDFICHCLNQILANKGEWFIKPIPDHMLPSNKIKLY